MKQSPSANGQRASHRVRRKTSIPREFAPLVNSLALDAQDRLQLWVYALVLLMLDEHQVRLIGAHQAAGHEWVTVQIYSGDEFEVVKPALSQENERKLLEGVRVIVSSARANRRPRK